MGESVFINGKRIVFPIIKNWKDVVANHGLLPIKGRNNAKQISQGLKRHIETFGASAVICVPVVYPTMDAIFHFVEFENNNEMHPIYEYMSVVS